MKRPDKPEEFEFVWDCVYLDPTIKYSLQELVDYYLGNDKIDVFISVTENRDLTPVLKIEYTIKKEKPEYARLLDKYYEDLDKYETWLRKELESIAVEKLSVVKEDTQDKTHWDANND